MKLLMISGDRSILRGKKGAFWYTLEEFHGYWERVDIICPMVKGKGPPAGRAGKRTGGISPFPNVYFHPNPRGLLWQECWIRKKGMELIAAHKHDIMTVHDYPPFFNGAGAKYLGRKTGIPYALEIHHIVGHPRAASVAELVGRMLSRFYFPRACRKATAVRVVSNATKETLLGWHVPNENIAVVHSCYLDHKLLIPDHHSIPKTYDIACGGRLVPNKGVAEVVRAVALLPGVSLVIFGEGPLRSSLEKLARSLNISGRVHFAGWSMEGVDVYHVLQSANIFVMNSRSEGGPRIALEAMALGLPVISTRVGVMPDVIVEGKNGLFTDGHPRDLAEKVRMLMSDSPLRERIGREARHVLTKFERTTLISRYAEFLQSLAQRFDS